MPSAYNTTKLKLAGEEKRFNNNINGILNWYIMGIILPFHIPKG